MRQEPSKSMKSAKNITIGLISQVITLLMAFASRTVFIHLLGAEYLGINSLFMNILYFLSFAELGIGNVMIYSLYKPVARKDHRKISALLGYYKKIYRLVALAVFLFGVALIPFLGRIVVLDIRDNNLVLYYLLFLLNSVISYFVIYKASLINADQKIYVIKIVTTFFIFLKNALQIVVLLLTGNYILYLCIMVACTFLENLTLNFKANRMYPGIQEKASLSGLQKKGIRGKIRSAFLYKAGGILMNHTDYLLISILIGTVYVGYYSNYTLIITAVTAFVGILVQGLQSSIGNMNAGGDMEKSHGFFNGMLLVFGWVSGFCALCFFLVFNDFITLWIGKEYILPSLVVGIIVFHFYLNHTYHPVAIYRETLGLFHQVRTIRIWASLINVGLSIAMGLAFGLPGILAATVLAKLATIAWYEPLLLYRVKFKKPVGGYWMRQGKYLLMTLLGAVIVHGLTRSFPVSPTFILIKIILAFTVLSLLFFLVAWKSREMRMLLEYMRTLRSERR